MKKWIVAAMLMAAAGCQSAATVSEGQKTGLSDEDAQFEVEGEASRETLQEERDFWNDPTESTEVEPASDICCSAPAVADPAGDTRAGKTMFASVPSQGDCDVFSAVQVSVLRAKISRLVSRLPETRRRAVTFANNRVTAVRNAITASFTAGRINAQQRDTLLADVDERGAPRATAAGFWLDAVPGELAAAQQELDALRQCPRPTSVYEALYRARNRLFFASRNAIAGIGEAEAADDAAREVLVDLRLLELGNRAPGNGGGAGAGDGADADAGTGGGDNGGNDMVYVPGVTVEIDIDIDIDIDAGPGDGLNVTRPCRCPVRDGSANAYGIAHDMPDQTIGFVCQVQHIEHPMTDGQHPYCEDWNGSAATDAIAGYHDAANQICWATGGNLGDQPVRFDCEADD